jgi:hypothetical protein
VLWFFSRDANELRVETRYDNGAAEYVLIVHWPDGRRETGRFSTLADFRERVVELQRTIEVEGWLCAPAHRVSFPMVGGTHDSVPEVERHADRRLGA